MSNPIQVCCLMKPLISLQARSRDQETSNAGEHCWHNIGLRSMSCNAKEAYLATRKSITVRSDRLARDTQDSGRLPLKPLLGKTRLLRFG